VPLDRFPRPGPDALARFFRVQAVGGEAGQAALDGDADVRRQEPGALWAWSARSSPRRR
jgi:hypothetical protein